MKITTSELPNIPMLGTREYIVISGKRDFAYGIKLRIQKRDDHPRFSETYLSLESLKTELFSIMIKNKQEACNDKETEGCMRRNLTSLVLNMESRPVGSF